MLFCCYEWAGPDYVCMLQRSAVMLLFMQNVVLIFEGVVYNSILVVKYITQYKTVWQWFVDFG